MKLELHGRVQQIQLSVDKDATIPFHRLGGRFFSEIVTLPAGKYAARVQVMCSESASGDNIQVTARALASGKILDSLQVRSDSRQALDQLYLHFYVDERLRVELCGYTDANCASTLLRFITIVSANDDVEISPEAFYFDGYTKPAIRDLNCVIFGTTAICNASCIHCPTNKEFRRGFAHGYMDWALFERIIEELAENHFRGWFLFGLFGEPLEDPLLERRLRFIKQMLPQARISIATNCGVYDSGKHRFLLNLADDVGVHVEAINPDIYNRLMRPLTADRVFPKIISLLQSDSEKKVHITTPVHRGNLAEIGKIRAYFAGHGAGEPHFTQIGNRSWEGGPWAELSLLPIGGFCFPDDLRTFVIDWDGAVLACCLDFSKSAQLGQLTKQSISEVLNSKPWHEMFEIHRTKNWAQKEACSRCRTDKYDDVLKLIQPLVGPAHGAHRFAATAFRTVTGVTRVGEDSIEVAREAADGIVIYGPYRRLDPGHYRVSHLIDVKGPVKKDDCIGLDIVNDGRNRTAIQNFPVLKCGPIELNLEFESDGSIMEFRIAKYGVGFAYRGAVIHQISASNERV
jgi:radical SAM protein with 4Fe4S-binding SPASM domain